VKVYRQEEWIKAYDDDHGGHLVIDGVNIDKNGRIESLRTTRVITPTLSAWGSVRAENVGIEGKKQFVFRDGEVFLEVDSNESHVLTPATPCELENPHVIPFSVWLNDWKSCRNSRARSDEDRIAKVLIYGCELNGNGIIRWLNAKVTWGHCYGPFGPLTTEMSIEVGRDIMCGTYGMHREELAHDDWEPNCCGDHGYRAYFTNDFDLVWSDDGRYHELSACSHYKKIQKVKWRAPA